MNNIIDPVNGNSYDIFSFEGKNLLKNYVKVFQNGGSRSDLYNTSSFSSEKDEALDNEKKRCERTENTGPYCQCITGKNNCHPKKYIGSTPNLKHSHKSIAEYYVKKMERGGFICPKCKTTFDTVEELNTHYPICEQIKFLVEKRNILVETLKKYGYTEFARKGFVDGGIKGSRPVEDILEETENLISDLRTYQAFEFPNFPLMPSERIMPQNQLIRDIVHNFNINTDGKNEEVDKALRDWIYALQQKVLANESSVEETGEQTTNEKKMEIDDLEIEEENKESFESDMEESDGDSSDGTVDL